MNKLKVLVTLVFFLMVLVQKVDCSIRIPADVEIVKLILK